MDCVAKLAGHLRPSLFGNQGPEFFLAHACQCATHPFPAAVTPIRDVYKRQGQDWASEGVQPIHSVADMQIVLVAPQEYKDASKIADLLRDMKFVVLNLAKTERDVARRLLDFVSGVIYTEDGHIMKVATNVYVVAPYFVDLLGAPGESDELYF